MRCHPQPYLQQLEAEVIHQILLRQATLLASKQLPFILSNENQIVIHTIHFDLAICLCHFETLNKLMLDKPNKRLQTSKKPSAIFQAPLLVYIINHGFSIYLIYAVIREIKTHKTTNV